MNQDKDIFKQKLEFEVSESKIEWLAQNWRKLIISDIVESPYLTLLKVLAEDIEFLPSIRQILEGLLKA